jgi:hypothetical protein
LARYADIGDDTVVETDDYRLAWSGEYMVVGNRWLPTWLEFETDGHDEPNSYCRVEIRDDVPRLVELGWRVREHQSEIRQKYLRETNVAAIVDVLYAMTITEVRDGEAILNLGAQGSDQDRKIRGFLGELRLGKGKRTITSELLRQVADVYRANIDHAPTEAVARTFGVRSRMASGYVQRAREYGFLPPTKQGKKQA